MSVIFETEGLLFVPDPGVVLEVDGCLLVLLVHFLFPPQDLLLQFHSSLLEQVVLFVALAAQPQFAEHNSRLLGMFDGLEGFRVGDVRIDFMS